MKKGKKDKNTFKFQNFAERISNLNIDVYHSVGSKSHEVPENDKDTFFRESLENWAELNCSLDFTAFYREVKSHVQSFNQLVFHKEKVIRILKKYLGKTESLALEPCLNLLSQLAKDLVQDFYPHFEEFFIVLIKLLKTQDTKLIEQTFVCFAYIFKFIWRCMVTDLEKVFRIFSCLFESNQKQHIQTFAAESFAFLIRKTKSQSKAVKFLLQEVSLNNQMAYGIGSMIFYAIKGIKEQLNSHAATLLQLCLEEVLEENVDKQQICCCLQTTYKKTFFYITPDHSSVIFDTLYEVLNKVVTKNATKDSLSIYLELLNQVISFKGGKFIPDQHQLHQMFESLLKCEYAQCDVLPTTIKSYLFINKFKVDQHSDLIKQYLTNTNVKVDSRINFCVTLFSWNHFNSIAKPVIVDFISTCIVSADIFSTYKKDILNFLVQMIHEDEHWLTGCFTKNISNKINFNEQVLDVLLKELDIDLWNVDTSWLWMVVVILSSVEKMPKSGVKSLLKFMKSILSHDIQDFQSKHLFTLSYTVRALLIMDADIQTVVKLESLVDILSKYSTNQHMLQCFQLYCSTLKHGDIQSRSFIKDIYNLIKVNLNSPIGLNRLLTLNILKDLKKIASVDGLQEEDHFDVIGTCISAEHVTISLPTYRDKLLHLRRLGNKTNIADFDKDIAVRFLIGNLFINFSLLWDPIIAVVVSYAEDENTAFWDIFKDNLSYAASFCQGTILRDVKDETVINHEAAKICFEKSIATTQDERADFFNFRILLWKAMTEFCNFVEKRSRDIVPLFFNFMSNEYLTNDEMLAIKQNISTSDHEKTTIDNSDDDEEITKENSKEEGGKTKSDKIDRKTRLKTLCAHLKLFTCFKNPKALSKEKRLFQVYTGLLTYKDNEVQTLALGCLMAYKFVYLKPYKENFDKLMNDTTFRDELVVFSTNTEEETLVKNEHKPDLMPVLIRLLYGKLQRKSGFGTSGKSSSSARRNVIMQFLSHCTESEIETFINLIKEPFLSYQEISMDTSTIDLTAVVPLRKQTGFLNMFSNILSRLNKMAQPFFNTLFELLLKILWCNSRCLSLKEQIHSRFINRLKDIRQLAITKLNEFSDSIIEFNYDDHIESIFTSTIWPNIKQLSIEATQHITPLFKLIVTWSKHSIYHKYLAKSTDTNDSLLSHLYLILKQKSISNEIEKQIMQISSNMLTIKPHKGKSNEILSSESGITLIKPYIPLILQHLHSNLASKTENIEFKIKKKVGDLVPKVQLSVLSLISKHVTDEKQCCQIVEILFPMLQSIHAEETQIHVLTTLKNLLPFVTQPDKYLNLIPCLFSIFQARKPRDILCEVYKSVSKDNQKISKIASLIQQTNTWNVKHLEEPDYEIRLKAFREINDMINKNKCDLEQYLPVMHNCLHFVMTSDDMSIRDAAVNCTENIINTIDSVEDMDLFNVIIIRNLLPSVKQGVKTKKESTRFQFIHLLSKLIKKFDHESFNDLKVLSSAEPETDFFFNITHIQFHRRVRAVHQLQAISEDESNKISVTNWFSLIIPIISHVIFDNLSTSKDHNLLSETIITMGSIMKLLPWPKYAHILRNYLKLLQKERNKQKTIIRVVVAILNNFHFDLSNVVVAPPPPPQQKYNKFKQKKENKFNGKNANKVDGETNKETDEKIEKESKGVFDKNIDDNNIIIDQQAVEEKSVKDKYTNDESMEISKKGDEENIAIEDADIAEEEDIEEEEDLVEELANDINEEKRNERIYKALNDKILPQLTRFLKKRSFVSSFHKLSYNKQEDDEEVMKVPIAYAVVKLLQQLPKTSLHTHLPGLLLRISQSLRSQARDVRDMGRDTMIKIARTLGGDYLQMIVKEMRAVLLRGYQLHVLGYSLHSVLEGVQDGLKPGDLDGCVKDLMEIVIDEQFGVVAEEKDVGGITVKLHEAKSRKSNDIIEILAKFVSNGFIVQLLNPLKEVLETTQSHKVSHKVEEALRKISVGLQHNKALSSNDIILFIHGILSKTLPIMISNETKTADKALHQQKYVAAVHEDIYTVPDQPGRMGKLPGISKQINEHIIVEFALQLLATGLKRQKFNQHDESHIGMLNPFIEILLTSLTSKYNKILILSTRAFSYLIRYPLPAIKTSIVNIARQLFKLLKKFSRTGGSSSENFELVLTGFKAMTVLIRDYTDFHVSTKQLEILLTFIEEDVHNSARQSTALPLLKAILARKFISKDLESVMKKIRDISIRVSDNQSQLQCRQAMLQYMLDYPLGKKLMDHLNFYVSHLSYEDEPGRISALEMLIYIFNNFPERLLHEHALFFFLPLTIMLSNDESSKCRKMVSITLKLLVRKVNDEIKNEMFKYMVTWLSHEKVVLQQVSVQLIGFFVEIEENLFESRIPTILPTFLELLRYKNEDESDDEVDDSDKNEVDGNEENKKAYDKLLYNLLITVGKLFMRKEMLLINRKYAVDVLQLYDTLRDLLLHGHIWIRISSSQLFSLYFACYTPEEMLTLKDEQVSYFSNDIKAKVTDLCYIFHSQLKDSNLTQDIADQATKNLIYLTKLVVLFDVPCEQEKDEVVVEEPASKSYTSSVISINRIIFKMSQLASYEASYSPKVPLKRSCVFRWSAALCLHLSEKQLEVHLCDILRPIHRELISTLNEEGELYKLSQEVIELIKSSVDKDLFALSYAKVQRKASSMKETRKRKIAEEAVHNPEKFALRKQKTNLAKRAQRKRKLYEQKPNLKFKKIRSRPEA